MSGTTTRQQRAANPSRSPRLLSRPPANLFLVEQTSGNYLAASPYPEVLDEATRFIMGTQLAAYVAPSSENTPAAPRSQAVGLVVFALEKAFLVARYRGISLREFIASDKSIEAAIRDINDRQSLTAFLRRLDESLAG